MVHAIEMDLAGRRLRLETGRVAKQADGAVLATYGDTVVLATAVGSQTVRPGIDFLPLTVDYQEKAYAAGKIPGGYFKREGRPSEKEVLTSRLIDRPMRPLFPEGYYYETQVIASVLSADQTGSSDVVGITAASAALTLSDIPFGGPVAGIRIGRVNGQCGVNPDIATLEATDLHVVVAGTGDAVMMVEGGGNELPESVMIDAIEVAHAEIKQIVGKILELQAQAGRPKRTVVAEKIAPALSDAVRQLVAGPIRDAILIPNKTARQERLGQILEDAIEKLKADAPDRSRHIKLVFHSLEYTEVRNMILERGVRADGRGPTDIRTVTCEVGVLPRTHGSALFTRGETQSLAVVTLGTTEDEQRIDALEGEYYRTFMLHYNFPPFSVGEARPLRSPGRREVGHGALAERALRPVIPSKESFPDTLRLGYDILESNGSSSMATVCGGALALVDAGVPIQEPVAGIAMGLIKEGARVAVLTDILGTEDQLGDMDFKVAGTRQGVTSIQMDIKIEGLDFKIISEALDKARRARLHILDIMDQTIARPRSQLSKYAPRIITIQIRPDKIGDIIGPKGKVIRGIQEQTGAEINVDDSGMVTISAVGEGGERARDMIAAIVQEPEVGKVYEGVVKSTTAFGAFVEIIPGVEGLLHISELQHGRTERTEEVVKKGDHVRVKLLEVDERGRMRLSRKALMDKPEAAPARSH